MNFSEAPEFRALGRDSPNPGMNPGKFFETWANFSFRNQKSDEKVAFPRK
jgi:hypothetical protein